MNGWARWVVGIPVRPFFLPTGSRRGDLDPMQFEFLFSEIFLLSL